MSSTTDSATTNSSPPDAFADATTLAERVRAGDASPAELVEQAIEQIEAVNGEVNAVVIKTYEKAREEAKSASGPFAGVPYLLKDTMASKGDLLTYSIDAVKRAGYKAPADAYLVEQMRDAGFVLVGKSNMPELAIVWTTEPVAWGPCRNPWDLSKSVGGSSGGAGAAVAAGMVSVAHGSDGGGSIREPASKNGVIGLKPTRGRLTQGPDVNDSDNTSGMAHDGFFTRSVRDMAGILDAVGGRRAGDLYGTPQPSRPYVEEVGADPGKLKIAVCTTDPAGEFTVDPDCADGTRRAADVLANLGHEVGDAFPAAIKDESWPMTFMPCVGVVMLREIERFSKAIGRELGEDDLEPQAWAYVTMGKEVTGIQYAEGVDALRIQAQQTELFWEEEGWDIWVTPTCTQKTISIGDYKPTKEDPFGSLGMEAARFAVPFNVSGQPAISLPLFHDSTGMPQGVQLVAAYGREDILFQVAAQLEREMPWADRLPPVHA